MKRKIADELTQRRSFELAALWGNPNYDPQKEGQDGARAKVAEAIENNYSRVLAHLYSDSQITVEDEPDTDDPFWQAMERGLAKHKLPEPESAANIIKD